MARLKLKHTDSPPRPGAGEQPPGDLAAPTLPGRQSWAPRGLAAGAFDYLGNWVKALTRPEAAGLQAPSLRTVHRGIAREFNRARRFGRPLSVLVLRTDSLKSTGVDVAVRVALQRLRDTDLWFHDGEAGDLVLVAPETGHDAVQVLGGRLAPGLGAGTGAKVAWSTATFPADGLTFEVLYEACTERVARPVRGWAVNASRLS
jgi:hypothetical protein